MLLDKHRSDLRKSGLVDSTIEASGVYSILDAAEYRRLANLPPNAATNIPALAFPYPDCPGFVRLRPDDPDKRNPAYVEPVSHNYAPTLEPEFVAGPRYLSPVGSKTRLYVQKGMCPAILDADEPLWLVEGEKKTLAAIQSGLVAIGAPGVTCFGDSPSRWLAKGSGKDLVRLHQDFRGIPLEGREVVICFDSDIDEKDSVLRAAVALAQMLDHAGADVRMAYVNPSVGGGKQGLDDYLASTPEEKWLAPHPLGHIEDSVRPFNVVECLEGFLAENWDTFSSKRKDIELRRAVRLACHLFKKSDLRKFLKQCSRELHVPVERVEQLVIEVEKEKPRDPRVWVGEWMSRNGVRYECRNSTDRYWHAGQATEPEVLLRLMRLDAETYGGPSRQSLDDALFVWSRRERESTVATLRHRLKHRPELDDSCMRVFVRALTGKEDPVDLAVMNHFIWQVKRKVNDREVEHHLMVILHGAQRAGKSVAIRKLLYPVEQFKDEPGDVTIVGDERQAFRFANSFVIFFDEMAKASKTDMDAFKNRISQTDMSWRALGTNVRQTAPNRATFIGASNNSLQDLIIDPTGVRRFYQLNCTSPVDWNAVNGIDYDALWASVDETGPAPVASVQEQLGERQEEMRVKDAVEEFLAARCQLDDNWTPGQDVFDAFKDFLKAENYPLAYWSSSKFGRRFTDLVGKERKKKSNGMKYQVTVKGTTSLRDHVDEYAQRMHGAGAHAQA